MQLIWNWGSMPGWGVRVTGIGPSLKSSSLPASFCSWGPRLEERRREKVSLAKQPQIRMVSQAFTHQAPPREWGVMVVIKEWHLPKQLYGPCPGVLLPLPPPPCVQPDDRNCGWSKSGAGQELAW